MYKIINFTQLTNNKVNKNYINYSRHDCSAVVWCLPGLFLSLFKLCCSFMTLNNSRIAKIINYDHARTREICSRHSNDINRTSYALLYRKISRKWRSREITICSFDVWKSRQFHASISVTLDFTAQYANRVNG